MILLDTSGLLCLAWAADHRHADARELFESGGLKLVHSYVLAEFVALADARGVPRPSALGFLDGLVAQPDVQVVWVDESMHGRAMVLLSSRPDKRYSLCDAVSFVLMRERGIKEALTTDRHFDQAGFRRLLPP